MHVPRLVPTTVVIFSFSCHNKRLTAFCLHDIHHDDVVKKSTVFHYRKKNDRNSSNRLDERAIVESNKRPKRINHHPYQPYYSPYGYFGPPADYYGGHGGHHTPFGSSYGPPPPPPPPSYGHPYTPLRSVNTVPLHLCSLNRTIIRRIPLLPIHTTNIRAGKEQERCHGRRLCTRRRKNRSTKRSRNWSENFNKRRQKHRTNATMITTTVMGITMVKTNMNLDLEALCLHHFQDDSVHERVDIVCVCCCRTNGR